MMVFVISLLLVIVPQGGTPSQAPKTNSLTTILKDHFVWGEDLPAVLADLPALQQVGESQIAVFSDRVVGTKAYEQPEKATVVAEELARTLGARRNPKPEFRDLMGAGGFKKLNVKAVRSFEDDAVHISLSDSSLRLLNAGLTRAKLEQRFGPPERVSTLTLQNQAERRPIVLTLYQYAGGAVVFAAPDISPQPGSIDRVLLDTHVLTNALFE